MAADFFREWGTSESGQSIMEFLILVPLILGFTTLVINMNTAVQSAIVNQQYARLQTHFLTFNNAWFPDNGFQTNLLQKKVGLFYMGVAENPINQNGDTDAKAPIVRISRSLAADRVAGASDDERTEPDQRTKVRIRASSIICPQSLLLMGGNPILSASVVPSTRDTTRVGQVTPGARYALNENSRYEFCSGGRFVDP